MKLIDRERNLKRKQGEIQFSSINFNDQTNEKHCRFLNNRIHIKHRQLSEEFQAYKKTCDHAKFLCIHQLKNNFHVFFVEKVQNQSKQRLSELPAISCFTIHFTVVIRIDFNVRREVCCRC